MLNDQRFLVSAAQAARDAVKTEASVRLGLTLPLFSHLPLPDFLALAREVEAGGYDTVWVGESAGADAVTVMTLLASATSRLRVAGGVLPFQTRTPVVLGMTGATLDRVAPGRVALGVGVSSRTVVEQWNGVPFTQPLARLREAIAIIRAVMSGERVTFEGEFYRVHNFRLATPPPAVPVKIYLAALGPRALELAGEIADGVLLNWLGPESVPAALDRLRAGAARAGRTLDGFEVAAYVRTCVTDAPETARAHLARDLTGYAVVDAYAEFFRHSGFATEMDALETAWRAGDRAGAVRCLTPRVLDRLGVVGPADFCRARLAEFVKAGLTMPVVVPFSPDAAAADSMLATLRAFLGRG